MPQPRAQRFFARDREAAPISDTSYALIAPGLQQDRLGQTHDEDYRHAFSSQGAHYHVDCSVQRAILPGFQSNFWSRQSGAGGGCTKRSNMLQSPESRSHAPYLCNYAQLATFVSHTYHCLPCLAMPSPLFAEALPTDGASHSLLSDAVSRSSPTQLPANASSAQGQCGKLTTLPLRASANTNTMTTAPNRSFSSSQVIREADTGQAFAPSRPPPGVRVAPQVSIDNIAFTNWT